MNLVFIFILGYLTTSLSKRPLDLDSLRLGNRGLSITIVYIVLLYVFMFFTLLPERIPPLGTMLLTVVFYIIVITMIFLTPRDNRMTIELPTGIFRFDQIMWALIMLIMVAVALAMISIVALLLGTLFYLAMIFMGPVLFFLAIVQVFRKARLGE
jgi:hypothetical protein